MPTVGKLLQPYRQQLQQLGMLISCVKLLRRFNLICQLKTGKYSAELSLWSILGNLLLAVLGMRSAQLRGDQLVMSMHSTCLLLAVGLLGFYYGQTRRRRDLWYKLLFVGLLMALSLWYSYMENVVQVLHGISMLKTGIVTYLLVLSIWRRTGNGTETGKKAGSIWGCVLSLLMAILKLLSDLAAQNNFKLRQHILILSLSVLRVLYTLFLLLQPLEEAVVAVSSSHSSTL
ncbi:hypothetical protein KR093_003472, partial [Drosophila rubida]